MKKTLEKKIETALKEIEARILVKTESMKRNAESGDWSYAAELKSEIEGLRQAERIIKKATKEKLPFGLRRLI